MIHEHYAEIVAQQQSKQVWWLAFFNKLKNIHGKNLKTRVCSYYLVVVEVNARAHPLNAEEEKKVTVEAQHIVRKAHKKIYEEDQLAQDEGILFPVHNILIVDKLRDENARLEEEKQVIQQTLEEKDQVHLKKRTELFNPSTKNLKA